ncbi:MAG: GNAT family protein [Pseudomonadota bacterium]
MQLIRRPRIRIETERLYLRPPEREDHMKWATLRREGEAFLKGWEPIWSRDHLTARAFRNRVAWARTSIDSDRALPVFLFRRSDDTLLGAVTLDNVRRGPAQSGTVGYWLGEPHIKQGYMTEALTAMVHYAFQMLDLSRVEAACLPENRPSRALLERVGFKYEGVAQAYLQINGRWRTHVLYAILRHDRRGPSDAG